MFLKRKERKGKEKTLCQYPIWKIYAKIESAYFLLTNIPHIKFNKISLNKCRDMCIKKLWKIVKFNKILLNKSRDIYVYQKIVKNNSIEHP